MPLSAAADPPAWRMAPREAWIHEPPADATLPLHDRQIRVTAAGDDRYEHIRLPLTPEHSGEQASQVSISLDPRFQLLVIHALKLTRAAAPAKVFNAAQLRDLITIQAAESDPQALELNPQLQLRVQIRDAQPGDVLDCEYTVHSLAARFPGVMAGHYAAQWSTGAGQPLHWERLRVLWPTARSLQYRLLPGAAPGTPQIQSRTGELEIQWRDRVQVAAEPDTPRWFTPEDLVQLSDFANWTEVSHELAALYEPAAPVPVLPPGPAATPAMILAALRLVHTKVHALNPRGGPYAPADPATVLQRGYGDSRDLARLLVSLLRPLGVDAQVALADSHRGAMLDASLPSPYLLDTALVLVRAGNLRYWINPAAAGPVTDLPTTDTADLRHALLISARDGKMVLLPPPPPDLRRRAVLQQFDLHGGNDRPATLTVTTQFHGDWAQSVRTELLAQTQAQLQLAQIQAVAQDYPEASAVGTVQLQDLPDRQALQLSARFRIPRPFGDADHPHFNFFAEGLAEAVQPRDEPTRRLPLGLPWPVKLEEHIEATVPADLRVISGTSVVENPAFRYRREVRFAPGRLDITHSYVTRSDHVDPADYPGYLAANARVYQLLGLRVQPDAPAWRLALDWLDDYWLQSSAGAAAFGALTLALWRRLRRGG